MKANKIKIQILLTVIVLFSCTSKTGKKETEHEVLAENAIELNAEQY